MSGDSVTLRLGSFTEKEIDVLGVACCGTGEFAGAVDLVERNADRLAQLVSHEFPLHGGAGGARTSRWSIRTR